MMHHQRRTLGKMAFSDMLRLGKTQSAVMLGLLLLRATVAAPDRCLERQ